MLDARVIVLCLGSDWRMLPQYMPPWILLHRTSRPWLAMDLFEQFHDALRDLWRLNACHVPDPSDAMEELAVGRDQGAGCRASRRCSSTPVTLERVPARSALSTASTCKWCGIPRTELAVPGFTTRGRSLPITNRNLVVLHERWVIESSNTWNDRPKRLNGQTSARAGWSRTPYGRTARSYDQPRLSLTSPIRSTATVYSTWSLSVSMGAQASAPDPRASRPRRPIYA